MPPSTSGKTNLRERARALRVRSTEAERFLWYRIRNRQLGGWKFVQQLPVDRFVADFACREAMLIVEIDGSQHADSHEDELRTAALNALGYSVLRFWNSDVLTEADAVMAAIFGVLEGHEMSGLRYTPAKSMN